MWNSKKMKSPQLLNPDIQSPWVIQFRNNDLFILKGPQVPPVGTPS